MKEGERIICAISLASILILIWFFILLTPAFANSSQTAVIVTVSPDWTSGSHSVISVDPKGGPRKIQNKISSSKSDLTIASYGSYFYIIERYGANNITKYSITDPSRPLWQFSTEGSETNSNPYDLIFVNEKKAYLLRYGSDKAWIVNPSTITEAGFKIGELDLSAYSDSYGPPDMSSGVIVGNHLFITLQMANLTVWPVTYDKPYVAVFDISTDEEIDTQKCNCEKKGILIPSIKNPISIQYITNGEAIYVQGVGDWDSTTDQVKGGIVKINPDTYQADLIMVDDPDYGVIAGMAILSESKGYLVGYQGWGDNTLYSFDPSCGCNAKVVNGFEHISIAGFEAGVYTDKNNMLWICNQSQHCIDILNTENDTIDESVSTELNPAKVIFTNGEPDAWNDGGGGGGCFISSLW